MSYLINLELSKISDWLAVNKLSLNVDKTKFMIFHNHQKVIQIHDIPCLEINNTVVERVTEFNFLGLTINEFMNWSSHSSKIANKISRTLSIMNRLKRYLPTSAMKLMCDSLELSHLQFGITCWGFEWERIFKLQKRALRIMTNCCNVVRHRIPELLLEFPANLMRKVRTHSISTFVSHVKSYMISSYSSECIQMNCYICQCNS